MTSAEAVPLASACVSVWRVLVAKSKIAVVKAPDDLTSIIGITVASAEINLVLLVSSIITFLEVMILSITLVIKLRVSISTFNDVTEYSASTSSAIALK